MTPHRRYIPLAFATQMDVSELTAAGALLPQSTQQRAYESFFLADFTSNSANTGNGASATAAGEEEDKLDVSEEDLAAIDDEERAEIEEERAYRR